MNEQGYLLDDQQSKCAYCGLAFKVGETVCVAPADETAFTQGSVEYARVLVYHSKCFQHHPWPESKPIPLGEFPADVQSLVLEMAAKGMLDDELPDTKKG